MTWDLETYRELSRLAGHTDEVYGVALSPDGRRAVSASSDTTVKVWDVETGHELRTLQGHSHTVSSVAVSPDGRSVVSASYDTTLKVWNVRTGALIATFTCDSEVHCCAFIRDDQFMAGD